MVSDLGIGQNSHGQGSGEFAQQRLSYYCASKIYASFSKLGYHQLT